MFGKNLRAHDFDGNLEESDNRPDEEMGLEREFLTEATGQQGNHQLIAGIGDRLERNCPI